MFCRTAESRAPGCPGSAISAGPGTGQALAIIGDILAHSS
jgi:hypothetical protein